MEGFIDCLDVGLGQSGSKHKVSPVGVNTCASLIRAGMISVWGMLALRVLIIPLEGFVYRVKQWLTYCFQGSLSFILACKLKALKVDLLVCNDVVFGNVKG